MTLQINSVFQKGRRRFLQTVGLGSAAILARSSLQANPDEQAAYPDLAQLRGAHEKLGMIPPDKTYRMMEWESHTWPKETRFDMNLEAAMKVSRGAGAEAMALYTQDTWGYAFYPTDVGVRHPGLKFDMFGRQAALAHQNGMSVVAYYSLQFNHQAVEHHPDWAWVDKKGAPRRLRWYQTCLDSPYRQYVLGMINEISSKYEIEELFIDAFGRQLNAYHSGQYDDPFCYCKHTEEAWNTEHPGDPYREGMNRPEGWLERFRWLAKRSTLDMLDEIIATARRNRPHLVIGVNGGPYRQVAGVMEKVSYISEEPLPSPSGIALGSIVMRGWGRPDSQGGVFTKQGFLDIYPGAVARVKADALLVQNGRVFFVANSPVLSGIDDQGFSKRWFQVAKEAFTDLRNVDCLMRGLEPVYSAAMFFSDSTRERLDVQKRPLDFRYSTLNALESLTYSGRPLEAIPEFRLVPGHLDRFELLVLPEVEVLSNEQAQVIRDWVKKGGILIASHRCGLWDEKHEPRSNFILADVFGVDYVNEERKYAYATTSYSGEVEGTVKVGFVSTYLESSGHRLAKMLETSTVGLSGTFLRLKLTTAEEVMHYRLPLMVEDLSKDQWYNWGPPPPGPEQGGPAVTLNQFGKGQALYLGVPIFWAMKARPYWIEKWIPQVVRQLTPNPIAELRFEPFSEYMHGTFFYDRSKRLILVQVLNTIELATNGELRAAPKAAVIINPEFLRMTGARMIWPKTEDLLVIARNGKTHVVLPNLGRYTALYLKTE